MSLAYTGMVGCPTGALVVRVIVFDRLPTAGLYTAERQVVSVVAGDQQANTLIDPLFDRREDAHA